MAGHGGIGSHNLFADYACRWLAAKCVHVLYKSTQLCKLLRDLGRCDEGAFAAANLDQTTSHKILNRAANGNAADLESRNQAVFGRQLVASFQVSIGDLAGKDRFDTRIQKRFLRGGHEDIIMSYRSEPRAINFLV